MCPSTAVHQNTMIIQLDRRVKVMDVLVFDEGCLYVW